MESVLWSPPLSLLDAEAVLEGLSEVSVLVVDGVVGPSRLCKYIGHRSATVRFIQKQKIRRTKAFDLNALTMVSE